ncbi:hypothetical protein SMICM304S_02968 [Streptomyces microflavus]
MIPPSRKRAPRPAAQTARAWDSAGVEVVRSTRSLPVRSASASASRTDASSSRQVTTSGLAATASAAVAATRAPRRASSVLRPGLRFQTVRGCPAASQVRASAVPMAPRPSRVRGVGGVGADALSDMRIRLVDGAGSDQVPTYEWVVTRW